MNVKQKRMASKMNPPSDSHFHLKGSNSFFEDVFEVVRLIPPGKVTTYGAIASFLGTGMSARMVGWAMNASHNTFPGVPAHRVVNRNGMLSGRMHFETPTIMEERLQQEGVAVKENTIIEFDKVFWDPSTEISI